MNHGNTYQWDNIHPSYEKCTLWLTRYFFSHPTWSAYTPTRLAILNSGKENLWASCSFSGNRLRLNICHIFYVFLQESGEAHHSCFNSTWHIVWLSKCGWKIAPVFICPTSYRYSRVSPLPLPHSFYLSFSSLSP